MVLNDTEWYSMVFSGMPLTIIFGKGGLWTHNFFVIVKIDCSVYIRHTQIMNQEMQNLSMQRAYGHDMI